MESFDKLVGIPLRGDKIVMDVSIAYMKTQPLSPPAKAFLETLADLQVGTKMTPQSIGTYMSRILNRQRYAEKNQT